MQLSYVYSEIKDTFTQHRQIFVQVLKICADVFHSDSDRTTLNTYESKFRVNRVNSWMVPCEWSVICSYLSSRSKSGAVWT